MPARRPDPPLEVRRFTPETAERMIKLLEARIADVRALDPKTVRHNDERVFDIGRRIRSTILDVFSEHSQEYRDHQYRDIAESSGGFVMGGYDEAAEDRADQERFARGIPRTITVLEGLINTVRERTDHARPAVGAPETAATISNNVFIVHGRKDGPREAVARFVSKFGLNPIILQEQASGGRTLIEKVEHRSEDVGFAIVLLTAEDLGGLIDADPATFQPRARQNVILELGYFVGKLGRRHVCVLHEERVEIPSDFHGVVYVLLDSGETWKLRLAKEMREAGLKIDMNLL